MAEYASPAIEVVKLVGSTVWKYIKFQIAPNSYVTEFQSDKDKLQRRLNDIESDLKLQLRDIGKTPKQEVEAWLEKARKAIAETDADEFNKEGCFFNVCRAKHFADRSQELRSLHEEGGTCAQAGVILVRVDHAVMQDYLMSEFHKKYAGLQCRKKDIESTLQAQIHFGKIAKEEVNGWLRNAGKILEAAHVEVSQSGCLSPPHVVGVLERRIQELEGLLENGANYTIDGAILVHDDPSTSKGDPLYVEKCFGRDTALAEILNYLKGDRVKRIAVWGMGGIGKTTLMKQIHNQFLNEAQYDIVVWVAVSSTLDIRRIQNEIAKQVDTELEEEDVSRRAGKVSALLRRGNYLLILDDVWEAFSDEDVGIPVGFGGLKIVLTTRAAEVARRMDCGEIIKLQPLSFEESLQLFREKVGKVVLSDDGSIQPSLEAILMQIVKECDGLPLAIVTVASTMKGMSDNRYSWVKALKQLQKGSNVVGSDKDPKGILKFSYDHLKDKNVQLCFLYCALFPEDFEISRTKLIEYWIEEGLFDGMDTRYEMTCEGREILKKLKDNCLLESVYDCEDDEEVKMHDLLRDMALDITSKSPRFYVKAGVGKEELQKEESWPENVEKVSLMENHSNMKEIPLVTSCLKYNMLTTLLIPNNDIVTIPEFLFKQTPGLRILDLSENEELTSLPDSISDLEYLTTLLLQLCVKLKRVPSLSKCRALTKLNLECSGIEEVPDGMEKLVNLKYFNLALTEIKLPEGLLPKLSKLQLLITRDKGIRVEDVKTLRKLEYLNADLGSRGFEEMITLLQFMQEQEQRLTSSTYQVTAPWLKLTLYNDLESIDALLCNDDGFICQLCSEVGQDEEGDVKRVNRILVNQALSLRVLIIRDSKNIECVFGWEFNPLQIIEDLSLERLANLRSVFDEETFGLSAPPSLICSFIPLKSVVIQSCPQLKKLFSSTLLQSYLQNLESILISSCKEMEEVISFPSEDEENLTLPKLKTLVLRRLPKLKSICSSSSSVLICDSLEILEIDRCEELNRIPLYFPQLDNAQPSSTLSLKKIKVVSERWWRFSTEWCHPKDMLLPFCEFRRRLPEDTPAVLKAAKAFLKLRRSKRFSFSTAEWDLSDGNEMVLNQQIAKA